MTQLTFRVTSYLLCLGVALTGCGKKEATETSAPASTEKAQPATPAKNKDYPASTEGLTQLVQDLIAGTASPSDLALPNAEAWFKGNFGDANGALVLAEATDVGDVAAIPGLLKQKQTDGKTELKVECFSDAGDPAAIGYQGFALAAMKTPIPLCSLRLLAPGKKMGFHIYNFVHVDGTWRLAGKMKSAKAPKSADPQMDAVSELRAADREEFFKSGNLPD